MNIFNNKNLIKFSNLNKGFTLVESLFAIMTLTFTITILMTVVSSSLFSSRYSKDEIVVSYLMQEVVDYIRNDRDTNVFLNNMSWDDFYNNYSECSEIDGGCYFAIMGNSISPINSCDNNCPYLYFDKNASYGSFYNYKETSLDGEENIMTNFKRKITVMKDSQNPDEININVNISWKNGSTLLERNLSNTITNWR